VVLNPTPEQTVLYDGRIREQRDWFARVESESALPAETLDGFHVRLAANIELPEEVETLRQRYGVGIGLFRTEFLFVRNDGLCDEEEHFRTYRKVAEDIHPHSVILRTLDIGGDKFLSHLKMPVELNPFLGMRAIRFCLRRMDVFRVQLRAILRASAFGKVRIMFPMISTLEELQQALAALNDVKAELAAEGVPHNPHLDVGMMIEVPSAALIADKLAPHVDFFSLGTNDLVQYSLAVDRSNPDISYLYQPSHPSIIRMLRHVVDAVYAHGKWIGICGEMASEPLLVPLVLGLGIHELSMSPVSIPAVKQLVRHVRMREAEALVDQAAKCGTAEEVLGLCRDFLRRFWPDLLPSAEP
jgi:phosphotransferase system enzyme I (PtsI)